MLLGSNGYSGRSYHCLSADVGVVFGGHLCVSESDAGIKAGGNAKSLPELAKIRIKQLGLDFAKSPVKQKTLFTIGYPSSVISL